MTSFETHREIFLRLLGGDKRPLKKNEIYENEHLIVGTPAWSSFGISEGRDPMEIVNNPLSGAHGHNVMYAFHFYAVSHKSEYLSKIRDVADYLPIFVTEWGTQTYSGDGANDRESSQ